jgi:hypothetical protein
VNVPSFKKTINQTLFELNNFFMESNPDEDEHAFMHQLYTPMSKLMHGVTGEAAIKMFTDAQKDGEPINNKYASMVISCAYCIQAINENTIGNNELSWLYLAEARYWCGSMNTTRGIEKIRDITISETRKDTARQGGKTSSIRFDLLKAEMYRLLQEKEPPPNGWRSRSHLARSLIGDLRAYANKTGIKPLSDTEAQTTISGWLKRRPDLPVDFPAKKTSQQKD